MDKGSLKTLKLILLAFLIGVTIFSLFKYLASLKERYELLNTLELKKNQAVALEQEKHNLLLDLEKEKNQRQEISLRHTELNQKLQLNEEKLAKLKVGIRLASEKIKQLSYNASMLKAENMALREEEAGLKAQLIQINQENNNLKARIGSAAELKKALKELKIQMGKVRRQIKDKGKAKKITEGNHGFLVKNGQPTHLTTVTIEVNPAAVK